MMRDIAVVFLAAILLGCIGQDAEIVKPMETGPVLSDYPELFEKDVIIVIGNNASGIEIGGADAIVENLFNLTGNMPVVKIDAEITEDELAGHNLILVGGADSNEVLGNVYDMTDAMRVTNEYPGAGKGVLEMMRNPWDSEKAVLLVAGSDGWGVKDGTAILTYTGRIIHERYVDTDAFNKFSSKIESLLIDQALSRPLEADISVYIYFDHKPTSDEIHKLNDLGVSLDMDHWIPPIGSHPYGFVPATLNVNSLYDVAGLGYVAKILSAERHHIPLEKSPASRTARDSFKSKSGDE